LEARLQARQHISFDYMARRNNITRRDVLRGVLKKRASDAKGCMTLPVTIAFFVLYAFSMRLHEDITNVFLLESALRRTVERTLEPVRTMADVWAWLQTAFVEDFFVQQDLRGEALARGEWSRVLSYSQVQGSVVLQQARTGPAAGPGRLLGPLRPELEGALPGASQGEGERLFLSPAASAAEVRQRLAGLRQRRWLDEGTSQLTVRALLMNAELGRPRLEQVLLLLSFSRGGGVYYKLELQPLFLEAFPSKMSICADITWLAMLLGNSLALLGESSRAAARGRGLSHYLLPSTLLEWIIVLGGWVNVASFWNLHSGLLAELKARLEALKGLDGGTAEEEQAAAALHAAAGSMISFSAWYRLGVAWYNLVLMLRFFLAFGAEPRLAVVVNTLKAVSLDLLHFLGLFSPTFVAYVVSGNLLFGRRLEEFSTLRGSIGTCFRIVVENEFEWERLSEEHFYTTAIWVWSFLLLVVLVMLNIVIAIILDVYNEVRQRIDSADSIFLSLLQMGQRAWNSRRWVRDGELDSILSEMDGSATITKSDLREMLPEMTETQSEILFSACRNQMAFQLRQEMKRAAFLRISSSIRQSVERANECIGEGLLTRGPAGSARGEHPAAGESRVPSRMAGSSRPFPGMPRAPGGSSPPLLAPQHAQSSLLATGEHDRPEWWRELAVSTDLQCQWLRAILAQLQDLQWKWHTTQRLDAGDRQQEAAAGLGAKLDGKEHGFPAMTPSGLPIL